ncbi:MAG TPA: hypothetical protein VNM48_14315 [Chloroflexota bacterium]|nr:hypothetical protein [Chloroflexota bacterium]
MTTTPGIQDARPLVTRSRAALERAVLEASALCWELDSSPIGESIAHRRLLWDAVATLKEWERLRAEAAG